MLLVAAWRRLLVAGLAVAGLWAAVLWVAPTTPSTAPAQPSLRVAALPTVEPISKGGPLRAIIQSDAPAPGGGRFDRFDVTAQPIVAPVNARGQVAFYATVLHGPAREGIFLAEAGQVTKVAAFGDSLPGGGTLAEFGAHPVPALNSAGHVAFVAQVAGGGRRAAAAHGRHDGQYRRAGAEQQRRRRLSCRNFQGPGARRHFRCGRARSASA